MTIYRIYTDNGNRAGFWVQHRKWNNMCARVHSIGGNQSGRLPGQAPLYEDAAIHLECFDVRSGRSLANAAISEPLSDSKFIPIAQPYWYSMV